MFNFKFLNYEFQFDKKPELSKPPPYVFHFE